MWLLRRAIKVSPNGLGRLLLLTVLNAYAELAVAQIDSNLREIAKYRAKANGYRLDLPEE